jgi:hypothetical protein
VETNQLEPAYEPEVANRYEQPEATSGGLFATPYGKPPVKPFQSGKLVETGKTTSKQQTRVARFILIKYTKTGKSILNYPVDIK